MSRKPNILLIYTDQQRHDTIASLGNPVIRTPNLDRLTSEGVAFTQATTPCPVCMPARWSLHTGQWTTTHRCYSNHHPGPRPSYDLPGVLKSVGYRTALVGKNHSFLRPSDLDYWNETPEPTDYKALRQRNEWFARTAHTRCPRLAPEPAGGGLSAEADHAKTDAAIDFIRSCSSGPFFLWLSYEHPHTPYYIPEPYFSMYHGSSIPPPSVETEGLEAAGKPFRQVFHKRNNDAVLPFSSSQIALMRRVYYGSISLIDGEVGRVLDFLDEQALAQNTLVVFTSDHGDYMGDHGLMTKSPALYDCLVRVPFVLRWGGALPSGMKSAELVSLVDLAPTFLEAAGVAPPRGVQGESILPNACGRRPMREVTFSEYGVPGRPYDLDRLVREGRAGKPFTNPGNELLPWEGNPVSLAGRIRMVRDVEWKLVEGPDGPEELYCLREDPNELRNLSGSPEHASTQTRLLRLLHEWRGRLPGIEEDDAGSAAAQPSHSTDAGGRSDSRAAHAKNVRRPVDAGRFPEDPVSYQGREYVSTRADDVSSCDELRFRLADRLKALRDQDCVAGYLAKTIADREALEYEGYDDEDNDEIVRMTGGKFPFLYVLITVGEPEHWTILAKTEEDFGLAMTRVC